MAWVGIAMAGASSVMSYSQGKQQEQIAQATGIQNEAIINQQADQSYESAKMLAEQQAKKDARLMAAQRARFGAAGRDISTGSALTVLKNTSYEAELERQRILAGGSIERAKLRTAARSARFSGNVVATQATNQGNAGFLSGLGQASSIYARSYT